MTISIMGYLQSTRSRWLDIGLVFFFCMCIDQDSVQVQNLLINNANNVANIQAFWPKKWVKEHYFLEGHSG